MQLASGKILYVKRTFVKKSQSQKLYVKNTVGDINIQCSLTQLN